MQRLFISVHDVSPIFFKELSTIFFELQKRKITTYNTLVTPNWHGKAPMEQDKAFLALLKKQKGTIVLHGYDHTAPHSKVAYRTLGLGPGPEFTGLSDKDIERRVLLGLSILKKTLNIIPQGFVPPYWQFPRKQKHVLAQYFKYYTDLYGIDYFDRKFSSVPLCYDCGKYLCQPLSLLSQVRARVKNKGLLRLALHPQDVTNGTFARALQDIDYLIRNGWEPSTYEDLIGDPVPQKLL